MSAPKPHWLCRAFGHNYARYIDVQFCKRCDHRPEQGKQEAKPAVTASASACACGDRSFAITMHDASGVIVRGVCTACVVREHISVIQAARQAGFDPAADVADFVAEQLDTLQVISAASRSALN